MELKAEIKALALRLDATNAYGQIIDAAIEMAQQDVLQALAKMIPELRSVTVTCEGEHGDDGTTIAGLTGFTLSLNNDTSVYLPGSDEFELFELGDSQTYTDVAALLALEVTSDQVIADSLPEGARETVSTLFDLLRDLPSFGEQVIGDATYILN